MSAGSLAAAVGRELRATTGRRLEIGTRVSLAHGARAYADIRGRVERGWGGLAGFATAYADIDRTRRVDCGAVAGFRMEW